MTLPATYFDDLYDGNDDPWAFRTRWYETRKRALTLAVLPQQRYRSAFEPGCSIGELTAELAPRCDRLLATDISAAAVEVAQRRTHGLQGVSVEVGAVPGQWPDGTFDLIVLSELGYYLSLEDLGQLDVCATGALAPGGTLVACHWRHEVADYPLTGDEVHERLGSGLHRLGGWVDDDMLLTVWSNQPSGVAERAGMDVTLHDRSDNSGS